MMRLSAISLMTMMFNLSAFAAPKIPVSVTAFTNEAAEMENPQQGCYYWHYWSGTRLGSALQERLVAELTKDQRFMVLERKNIKDIYYGEHELINSHKTKQIEKGQFQQAKYTLIGVVKTFEMCSGGTGAHVDVGSLLGIGRMNVGGKRTTATVEVEIRLVETRTGQVIASESGSSDRESMSIGLDGNIRNVNFGGNQFKNSPLGKAIDEAIHKAAHEIMGSFPAA